VSTSNADDDLDELRDAYDGYAMLAVIRRYGRGELPQFALGAVASVLSRSTELVPAFVIGVALDAIFNDARTFSLPLIPQGLIPAEPTGQLYFAVGIIAGAYVFGAVTGWVNSWAWNHFSQHLQHELRTDAYDAMQRLELGFFDAKQTGEVMSVLNNDVNQLENFLTDNLNNGIRIVVRVGGMGLVMLLMNWQLALIPVATIPILGVASYWFVQIIHPKYQEVRSSVGNLNSRLENNIGGIETVKAYNKEPFEYSRVEEASEEYLDSQWDAITSRIKFFPTLRVVTAAGFATTLLVGGVWVLSGPPVFFSGSLTIGTLVTFVLYTRRFIYPMNQLGRIVNNYQYAEAASERIMGLMHRTPRVTDSEDPVPLDGVEGRVEYDDVGFRYEEGGYGAPETASEAETAPEDEEDGEPSAWILRDVDFEVDPGELVGLVGPTGAGKTTLIKLLMRMYDVDGSEAPVCQSESHGDSDDVNEGAVRIDGVDVRDASLQDLREVVSYVSQEPYLFYGTVRENIAYGDPDVPAERVREVAERAGAHEFIEDLPEGYDTMVGERGVKLSGGQRQRVAIARAILRDPDILILDEATSHVDNETEVLIQNSLDELIADRTTFAIAHRLSTVRDADRILVLDDGELVEEGTHEDLLAEDGLYANLWSVQVGEIDDLPEEFIERTARRQATTD
jgi:ATP-binding cassette subfamily B protein